MGNSGSPFDRVEDVDVPALGRLGHGVHPPPPRLTAHERRRRGKIAVPDIVLHRLEMPHALAGIASSASSVLANRLSPTRLEP